MTLEIPEVLRRVADTHRAAALYADAGWYVLPVRAGRVKHAGSVLGAGWPEQTSTARNDIDAWFGTGDHHIALHVGRSGAICFDVDEPRYLPQVLLDAFADLRPAFQSTRIGDDVTDACRGHYLFALPDGVMLGNSLGRLRTDPKWGDVRGHNGIIVVSPTHRPENHKRYHWVRTGPLPELPRDIVKLLIGHDATIVKAISRSTEYRNRRLDALRDMVTHAQHGERNNVLFWVACRLGEMTAIGQIPDSNLVANAFIQGGVELGLRQAEAAATVNSGLHAGRWVMAT